jgi:separase
VQELLAAKDGMLPPCTPCLLLSQAPGQYNELVGLKSEMKNLKNAESVPPLDVKVKRTSRTSSRLAKEQNVAAHAKTRTTRSSKRTAHVEGEKDLAELNNKNDISWSNESSTDALVFGKLNCSLDSVDLSKDGICNLFGTLDVGIAFLPIHSMGALGIYFSSEKTAFTDDILCRFC